MREELWGTCTIRVTTAAIVAAPGTAASVAVAARAIATGPSERDPRDVFTRDLDLPRGNERRPVRERDRVYEIDGTESRMLATIGAFRVVVRERSARPARRFPQIRGGALNISKTRV